MWDLANASSFSGVEIGASCTLSDIEIFLKKICSEKPSEMTQAFSSILKMLDIFAGVQIRNVAVSYLSHRGDCSSNEFIYYFSDGYSKSQTWMQFSLALRAVIEVAARSRTNYIATDWWFACSISNIYCCSMPLWRKREELMAQIEAGLLS